MKNVLAIFDLDGTLTRKDTFLCFLMYTHGWLKFYLKFIGVSPFVIFKFIGLYRNSQLKEKVLGSFYKGYAMERLEVLGNEFAEKQVPTLLREEIYDKLLWHRANAHQIVILTASCDIWLKAWCDKEQVKLISSRLEVKDGLITGKLHGLNCYGAEKKRRLEESFDMRSFSFVYAYGDRPSDRFYMDLANEKHWV
jgi:phosphatidylglycerophosphatase C